MPDCTRIFALSFYIICLYPLLRVTEAEMFPSVAEHLGVSLLPSVAAAWQSPGATPAQAASVSAGAEHPPQKGPGQTTQPGAKKSAASLPEVLLSTGEQTKHDNPDLVMHCTALQHIIHTEKTSAVDAWSAALCRSGVELSGDLDGRMLLFFAWQMLILVFRTKKTFLETNDSFYFTSKAVWEYIYIYRYIDLSLHQSCWKAFELGTDFVTSVDLWPVKEARQRGFQVVIIMHHIIIYYNIRSSLLSLNVLLLTVAALKTDEVIYIHFTQSVWFHYGAPLIITAFTVVPLSLTIRELMCFVNTRPVPSRCPLNCYSALFCPSS